MKRPFPENYSFRETNHVYSAEYESDMMLYCDFLELKIKKSGDANILIKALETIGKWDEADDDLWDDPGDCALEALVKYRRSLSEETSNR